MERQRSDAGPHTDRSSVGTVGQAKWEEPVGWIEVEDYLAEWKHNKEGYKDTRITYFWRNERREIFTWPTAA